MVQCLPRKLFLLSLLLLIMFIPARVLAQTGILAIIHSTLVDPVEGEVAYTVRVFLSVLDVDGNPLKDLTQENFTLAEDSLEMEIASVEPVSNEETNIVLVLDTSGSMLSQGIIDARNAASGFFQRLGSNDQAAVIAFDDQIKTVSPFSNDHQASSEAVQQINATNLAGTCLYDAAYQAVEMASATPPGRRAVVVFTDGKDETAKGEKCSFHTIEDVFDLAKTTGTPVYTLGMGKKIDEKELKRLAAVTGGSFLASRDSTELDAIFTKLYEQLNNEYILTYTSTSTPGPHTLTVEVNYRGQQHQSTNSFSLPVLPTTITFNSPADGETLTGKVPLVARLLTQGAQVSSVEFATNGVVIAKDISEPYEYEWDVSDENAGEILLEAVAVGKDGNELARTSLNVLIPDPIPISPGEEANGDDLGDADPQGESTSTNTLDVAEKNTYLPMALGAGGLVLAGITLAAVKAKRGKKAKNLPSEDDFGLRAIEKEEHATFDELDLRGLVNSTAGSAVIATLTVLVSDDPASIGHQYSITSLPVTLGRSAENADILFSGKDQAISRRHAMLEEKDRDVVLRDLGSKYGTFHNGRPVNEVPVELESGDEIRLGSRTKLRFDRVLPIIQEGETFDDLDISKLLSDETRDSF